MLERAELPHGVDRAGLPTGLRLRHQNGGGYPTYGYAKWQLSWNIGIGTLYTHTRFCTFGTDFFAQSVLINKVTNFLHRSPGGSLLRVHCWLGRGTRCGGGVQITMISVSCYLPLIHCFIHFPPSAHHFPLFSDVTLLLFFLTLHPGWRVQPDDLHVTSQGHEAARVHRVQRKQGKILKYCE